MEGVEEMHNHFRNYWEIGELVSTLQKLKDIFECMTP